MNPHRIIQRKFKISGISNMPLMGRGNRATRDALAQIFAELGHKRGAEIGVCRAEYSELLLKYNPELELLCVDPWTRCPGYRRTYTQAINFQQASDVLSKYPNAKIMRMLGTEAAKEVPDNSLDFVYIDALHDFDSVMLDIIDWAPKVRPGGIVSGHDYIGHQDFGVIPAVEGYVRGHNIQTWYITWADPQPSWFWVK